MRNSLSPRSNSYSLPWKWILIIGVIFGVLFFLRGLSGNQEESKGEGLIIQGSGTFVVTNKDGAKNEIAPGGKFYQSDALLGILSGNAETKLANGTEIFLDKNSEVAHDENGSGGLVLTQGRIWIEAKGDTRIALKHIALELSSGDIALLEQQRIYSIAYVMKGDALVKGGERQASLIAGKRIMVSQSNLINPGISLESLIGNIDESIQQNAFFIARNGKSLLENIPTTASGVSQSGTVGSLGSASGTIGSSNTNGAFISITRPADGSVITGSTFIVEGKVLSSSVKKISLNDQAISINPGQESWKSKPLNTTSSTTDVVYKVFDAGNNLLERGVLSLYSGESQNGSEKLVPITFPTSDKDFRIISPTENPYKTSLSAVTVSGTVPKGTVEYITVNNFRLKKFVAKSTNWYYYANTAYQTMKEGFNLYEIKFYGPNDTLLSTQLFTIIKEGGSAVSGEL